MAPLLLGVVILLIASPVLALSIVMIRRGDLPREARLPTTTLLARLVGVAVGTVAAFLIGESPSLGMGALLAGPAFGLCVLAGVLTGEQLAPQPTGTHRVASLETRRIRDYLPRGSTALAVCMLVMLVTLLTVTGLLGVPDDLGRAGRAVRLACGDTMHTRTPWPGWFYGAPTLGAVAVGLLGTAVALRTLIRRASPDQLSPFRRWDDLHRARGAQAAISAFGVLVSLPLAGSSLIAAGAVGGLGCEQADGVGSSGSAVSPMLSAGILFGVSICAIGALAWFVSQLFAVPKAARVRLSQLEVGS